MFKYIIAILVLSSAGKFIFIYLSSILLLNNLNNFFSICNPIKSINYIRYLQNRSFSNLNKSK